jgi:hypothetical protein
MPRNSSLKSDYFETWTPNMAWALGYLWADGSTSQDRPRLRIGCVDYDEILIQHLKSELHFDCKVNRTSPREGKSGIRHKEFVSVSITSSQLVQSLVRYGIVPHRVKKEIPCPEIPPDCLGSFVRGYFEGDGTFYVRKTAKSASFILLGSSAFLQSLQRQMERTLEVREKLSYAKHGIRAVAWTHKTDLMKIFQAMYPSGDYPFLPRKKKVFEDFLLRLEPILGTSLPQEPKLQG